MPKKTYTIDEHGPKRLEIQWHGGLYYLEDGIHILVDGVQIGLIPTSAELKQGREFTLPDSSTIMVKLEKDQLLVLRNGCDLALIERARQNIRLGWSFFVLLGALNLVGGVLAFWGIVKFQNSISMIAMEWICGILFLGTGWWASRKSIAAFVFGAILFAFEIIFLQAFEGKFDWLSGLTIVWWVFWCYDSIRAIRRLTGYSVLLK